MTDRRRIKPRSNQLPVPVEIATVLDQQWRALAEPGTWWTGSERIAIAAEARAARDEVPLARSVTIAPAAQRAAALVAIAPHRIDRQVVDDLEDEGLDRLAYVELVGVVARVIAMDTAERGLGAGPTPLPTPQAGEPTRETVASRLRSAWVPMVGGAGPTTALSAVPREDRAQEELHGALYLSYAEMGDLAIVKGLARAQMETVAARTSLLNHCHF